MRANELRIGNYVWLKSHHYPVQVDQIFMYHDDSIWIGTDLHEGEKLEDYEPIELTEEWLIKFGFEKEDFYLFKQYEWNNWGMRLNTFDSSWVVFHGFANQFSELAVIKYVHQLQNLYFALTGEELEIINNEQEHNSDIRP